MISRRLTDGRILTVAPEIFGGGCIRIDDNPAMHRIAERTGEPTESDGGADFYFEYDTMDAALEAFRAMGSDDREPTGWIRAAPPRFRRRPGGDPEKEYMAE